MTLIRPGAAFLGLLLCWGAATTVHAIDMPGKPTGTIHLENLNQGTADLVFRAPYAPVILQTACDENCEILDTSGDQPANAVQVGSITVMDRNPWPSDPNYHSNYYAVVRVTPGSNTLADPNRPARIGLRSVANPGDVLYLDLIDHQKHDPLRYAPGSTEWLASEGADGTWHTLLADIYTAAGARRAPGQYILPLDAAVWAQ